jgi:purine nucleoside permease
MAPVATPAAFFRIKVVVRAMFEGGEDTGDTPGQYQPWVEREHLYEVLPPAARYHLVQRNKDGVLGMLTGIKTAKAAASVSVLGHRRTVGRARN